MKLEVSKKFLGMNTFKYHVFKEGHEMKTIEETTSIIHLENNHRKINTLEEIKILKATSSKCLFNDVIAGLNDPIKINSADQANKQNFKNQQLQ